MDKIWSIDPTLFQVFLMSCHCSFPLNFAKHHWFVVNKKGNISRFEVLFQKDCCGVSWGHLHKDVKAPFDPLGTFTLQGKGLQPKLIGLIEGSEGSAAQKMADFIENTPQNYPNLQKYRLLGPNSNTYTQWVLDRSPEFEGKLSWNAFGKGK